MLKDDLTDFVAEILQNEYKINDVDSIGLVTIPPDISKGHLTTNAGLKYFKSLTKEVKNQFEIKNPMDFAESILKSISVNEIWKEYMSEIEVAKPGFVNMFFNDKFYFKLVDQMLAKGSDIGKNNLYEGQKVVVEYTDPNPFKEFHIGHLMPNTIGESISRIIEHSGGEVRRVCYQGDAGMHVAMSIWGIYELLKEKDLKFEEIEEWDLFKRIEFLGLAYACGANAYENEDDAKNEIKELNYIVYISAQKRMVNEENWKPVVDYQDKIKETKYDLDDVYKVYYKGRSWSLEYFESIYKRLGTDFDAYYFESEVGEYGYKYVMDNLKSGIFIEDDGAIIFPGEKYDLHNRVFINSQGLPTYEAKELGLAPKKYDDSKYDLSVIVTGNEIAEYFRVLLKALSLIRKDLSDKTKHISHGMLRLTSGKMSSRKGGVIKANDLLDSIKDIIYTNYIVKREGNQNINESEIDIDALAVGSLKFSILKNNIGKDIVFNPDSDTSINGDTSAYVNYVYARCRRLIEGASATVANSVTAHGPNKVLNNVIARSAVHEVPATYELILTMAQGDNVINRASCDFEPHHLAQYILDISKLFNQFYSKETILGNENEEFYLNICNIVTRMIENYMKLLGIRLSKAM